MMNANSSARASVCLGSPSAHTTVHSVNAASSGIAASSGHSALCCTPVISSRVFSPAVPP